MTPASPDSASPSSPAPSVDEAPAAGESAGEAPATPALSEDQLSGRLFVRHNALALVLGLIVFVLGGVLAPSSAQAVPEDPWSFLEARWKHNAAEAATYLLRSAEGGAPVPVTLRVFPRGAESISIVAITSSFEARTQAVVDVDRLDPARLLAASTTRQGFAANGAVEAEVGASGWSRSDARKRPYRGPALLPDQLLLLVRTHDWSRAPELELRLAPSLGRPYADAEAATLSFRGEVEARSLAGVFACDHLVLKHGEREDHYWVARNATRDLVKFEDERGVASLLRISSEPLR